MYINLGKKLALHHCACMVIYIMAHCNELSFYGNDAVVTGETNVKKYAMHVVPLCILINTFFCRSMM